MNAQIPANTPDPALLTKAQLADAPADERAGLVEAYLLASISALKPEAAETLNASCRLADIGIDSLLIIELKFELDLVLGRELDIELVMDNPTIRELAESSVRAAGF